MVFSPAPAPPLSSPTPPMPLLSLRPTALSAITTAFTFRQPWKPLPTHSITSRQTQQKSPLTTPHSTLLVVGGGGGGGGGSNNWWEQWACDGNDDNDANNPHRKRVLFYLLLSSLSFCFLFRFTSRGLAIVIRNEKGFKDDEEEVVWKVKGGKRTKLIPDDFRDEYVVSPVSWASKSSMSFGNGSSNFWVKCRELFNRLMLPDGFPESVTSDYLEFSLWRGVQEVAAQVTGVLATQSLLYAVGLGKGAIPAAAAVNWVLKDGIGYLSKILLSNFGRHFDVNPKGWRLFADFVENASFGMEILTPAFPHLFVPIGAAAGAGRSAAALIQAATGSCFYAGFAAQRNFAEVIAKAEAQGMVSKSIGIMLGIALANCIQTSTPLALASFCMVTWVNMFCNMKAYQSVQLRTLNPYRASLVFGEYLVSGLIPSVKEVNDEEPFFSALPILRLKPASKLEPSVLSAEAKDAAAVIEQRLRLGAKLSDVVETETDTLALLDLYRHQGYILTEHGKSFCVILKESCSPQDMLKSMFHVSYLCWSENNVGTKSRSTLEDCGAGGTLRVSLEYVEREFEHARRDGEVSGWVTDGLVARPLPHRIRPQVRGLSQ